MEATRRTRAPVTSQPRTKWLMYPGSELTETPGQSYEREHGVPLPTHPSGAFGTWSTASTARPSAPSEVITSEPAPRHDEFRQGHYPKAGDEENCPYKREVCDCCGIAIVYTGCCKRRGGAKRTSARRRSPIVEEPRHYGVEESERQESVPAAMRMGVKVVKKTGICDACACNMKWQGCNMTCNPCEVGQQDDPVHSVRM